MALRITALSPQFIREPRPSDMEEEAVIVSKEMGEDSRHRTSAVNARIELNQQNESGDSGDGSHPRSQNHRDSSHPDGRQERQSRLRAAVLEAEDAEAVLALIGSQAASNQSRLSPRTNALVADPVAQVLRRLAFQSAEEARRKQRALETYARIKAEPHLDLPTTGFHVDLAA